MRAPRLSAIVALLAMLVAAWMAQALTPVLPPAPRERIDLAALVPANFAGWREDNRALAIPSGAVQAQLDKIYDQTLTRIYQDRKGRSVILVIAYGGVQSRGLQVHRPEVCYPAQGFQEAGRRLDTLDARSAEIPVMRLIMTQGQRYEPLTYWVRIGDRPVRGNLEQGFARLEYGLRGVVPDGLLFRVSTIGMPADAAFAAQDDFVRDLLRVLPADSRRLLIGAL